MRKLYKLSLIVGVCMMSLTQVVAQEESDWKVVFEDQFEQDGNPDWTKWRYCDRYSSDWNKYLAASDQNVFVKDGKLVLKAFPNPDKTSDPVPYHTGGIETNGKFSFKYGKVEVSAKLGKGKGSWPAIWMMPQKSSLGWPACGEIDIMEHLNFDNIFYSTIHTNWHNILGKGVPTRTATIPFTPSNFNTFGVEWFEDRLSYTLNGSVVFTYPRLYTQEAADGNQWPFSQEFYLILNQAAGGSWVGNIIDSDMPFQMEVDWVKIYQKEGMSTSLCPHVGTVSPGSRGIKTLKSEGLNTVTSTPSGSGAEGYFNQKSECTRIQQGNQLNLTFDMQSNSKWSGIAIFIDWNGNGTIEEGEIYNPLQTDDSRLGWNNADDYLTNHAGAFTFTPAPDNAVSGFKYSIDVPDETKIGDVVMRIICDEAGQHTANANKFVCCATGKQYQGGIYDYELKISAASSNGEELIDDSLQPRIGTNPVIDLLTINNLPKHAVCCITNNIGQKIKDDFRIASGESFSVAHLPAGLYLLSIKHEKGESCIKFLKR